jgi:hypothetical protein
LRAAFDPESQSGNVVATQGFNPPNIVVGKQPVIRYGGIVLLRILLVKVDLTAYWKLKMTCYNSFLNGDSVDFIVRISC